MILLEDCRKAGRGFFENLIARRSVYRHLFPFSQVVKTTVFDTVNVGSNPTTETITDFDTLSNSVPRQGITARDFAIIAGKHDINLLTVGG